MNLESQSRTFELLDREPRLRERLLEAAHNGAVPMIDRVGLTPDDLEVFVEGSLGLTGLPPDFDDMAVEAIVRDFGRPSLLVENGTWVTPVNEELGDELDAARGKLEPVLGRVGRIEFRNVPMAWGGTGWVVDQRIVVTNRHVAKLIASDDGRGRFRFNVTPAGIAAEAKIDFRAERGLAADDSSAEFPLTAVRYVASQGQPDIALFELARGVPAPAPISLDTRKKLTLDTLVAVVGYPAFDSRNDPGSIERYFGDVFDVKRIAPGLVTQAPSSGQAFFMHDATTLGGNSGSVVLDLVSGKALGLHFAGSFHEGNYAVTATQVKKAMRGLKVTVAVPESLAASTEAPDGAHPASYFAGRAGYSAKFLGSGAKRLPVPDLGTHEADLATVATAGVNGDKALDYTHFSVKYSASRQVPRLTACNIDGGRTKKVKRSNDKWFSDGRIPAAIQMSRDDYGHPDIDRGHMVRREDPNWGDDDVVVLANSDTFHYTNAAPQHADLNQRSTQWLGLENYVLESAKTHGFKVSVFTGPILRDDDPRLDNGVQVPREFWKIVVALNASPRRLRATGYVLSQGDFIADITEGFTYGEYRTYQVPIRSIAEGTGYDLARLVAIDAMEAAGIESPVPNAAPVIALDSLDSMVL